MVLSSPVSHPQTTNISPSSTPTIAPAHAPTLTFRMAAFQRFLRVSWRSIRLIRRALCRGTYIIFIILSTQFRAACLVYDVPAHCPFLCVAICIGVVFNIPLCVFRTLCFLIGLPLVAGALTCHRAQRAGLPARGFTFNTVQLPPFLPACAAPDPSCIRSGRG